MPKLIPYRTFPNVALGPLELHTFGVLVAAGVATGIVVLRCLAVRRGVDPEALTSLAIRVVVVGVAGARSSFVFANLGEFSARPWAVVALWEGGLHFFGGFAVAAAVLVAWCVRHPELPRRLVGDVFAVALAAGLAVGRLGCVAVGEHLGRTTSWPFAAKFVGGDTIEPVTVGTNLHLPALYEAMVLGLVAIVGVRLVSAGTRAAGWTLGMFLISTGALRFGLDFLRVNDNRVLGFTGAQLAAATTLAAGALVVAFSSRRSSALVHA